MTVFDDDSKIDEFTVEFTSNHTGTNLQLFSIKPSDDFSKIELEWIYPIFMCDKQLASAFKSLRKVFN